MDTARAVTYRFDWIEDEHHLRRRAPDIIALVNASVDDDGMLGYAARLSSDEEAALIGTWSAQIAAGTGHVVLITDDDGVCGMTYMRTNANANYRHIADLSKGILAPRARGGGRATRAMFRAVHERGRELGIALFTLDTRAGSRAEAVWKHFGFTTWGVLDDYSRAFGQSHRGAYMSQTLESLGTTLARYGENEA